MDLLRAESLPMVDSLLAQFTGDTLHDHFLIDELLSSSFLRHYTAAEAISASLVRVLLRSYFRLSCQADCCLVQASQIPDRAEACARNLTRYFNLAVNDRSATGARKSCLLAVFSVLMAAYVRLGNWRLAGNAIRAVDALHETGDKQEFSKSDRICHAYWRGRYALSQGEAEVAEKHLACAMSLCKSSDLERIHFIHAYRAISRSILLHRFPRQLPSNPILFAILNSVKRGDLCSFRHTVQQHQTFLLKRQLYYIIVSSMSHQVIRQLVRFVWLSMQAESRIPLQWLVGGARAINAASSVDLEEMECLLANSINSGLIKGYISHDKAILVLSKKNPFP